MSSDQLQPPEGQEKRLVSEGQVFVLSPADPSMRETPPGVRILDVLIEVWLKWPILAAGGVVGALLGLWISSMGAVLYEATATLLIQPSKLQTELTPDALGVAAYERLLLSDFTAAAVLAQLEKDGALSEPLTSSAVGSMVSTSVPATTRMRGLVEQLPMIEVSARAKSPNLAMNLANTYAQVFSERTLELRTRGREGSLDVIEQQYPLTRQDLETTEEELNERSQHYADALYRLDREWQDNLARHTEETDKLVLDYEHQTTRFYLEFERDKQPGLLRTRLEAQKAQLTSLEAAIEMAQIELHASKDSLAQLEEQVKEVPQVLVLSKDIGDEAVWDQLDEQGNLHEQIRKSTLKTEVVNSSYSQLFAQLVTARVSYRTYNSKLAVLKQTLEAKRVLVDDITEQLTQLDLEKSKLEGERDAGLEDLNRKRARELALQKAKRDRAELRITGSRDMESVRLQREKDVLAEAFSTIANQFYLARVTRASQDPDVKIGALAVAPQHPIPRARLSKTLLGGSLGFFLAMLATLMAVIVSKAAGEALSSRSRRTNSQVTGAGKQRLVGG